MKIFCLIDSLNAGGAQRQMCMLIQALDSRGFNITLCTYHEYEFYSELLADTLVKRVMLPKSSKFQRVANLWKLINKHSPDLVLSYLSTPNLIAEVANLPFRHFPLIVSERNTFPEGLRPRIRFRLNMHRVADRIVANSYAQKQFLDEEAPYLRHKTVAIHNCVDLVRFKPVRPIDDFNGPFRFIIVGRFEAQKNPFAALSAVETLLQDKSLPEVSFEWYGNDFFEKGMPTDKSSIFLRLRGQIRDKGLDKHFILCPQRKDIEEVYHGASAICVPSLWEGCSNVICEAMACGRPVLASCVGDNDVLVEDGVNGYIFDPLSEESIATTIRKFINLNNTERQKMGRESRRRAEQMLSVELFEHKYLELIKGLLNEKRHNPKHVQDLGNC